MTCVICMQILTKDTLELEREVAQGAHRNCSVASCCTVFPLESRMVEMGPATPISFAQKAAARRTHTEGRVTSLMGLVCAGANVVGT